MTQEELDKILENHLHWWNEDCEGWEDMKANLIGADLRGANLRGANLRGADLRDANLIGADLVGANLRDANLIGADLVGANLRDANLRDADLRDANLIGADLVGANLRDANLRGANLIGADLRGANLRGANLRGADLRDANLIDADLIDADLRDANLIGADLVGANIPFIPMTCPDSGEFIAWKKASKHIVKLKILEDSKRTSATGRKCRCDKALVLAIETLGGESTEIKEIASNYTSEFIYKVGEIVEEPNFCEDRFKECSEGIHFFINRQEAVDY